MLWAHTTLPEIHITLRTDGQNLHLQLTQNWLYMSPYLEERSPKSTAQSKISIDLHLSTSQTTSEQSHDKIDGTVTSDLILYLLWYPYQIKNCGISFYPLPRTDTVDGCIDPWIDAAPSPTDLLELPPPSWQVLPQKFCRPPTHVRSAIRPLHFMHPAQLDPQQPMEVPSSSRCPTSTASCKCQEMDMLPLSEGVTKHVPNKWSKRRRKLHYWIYMMRKEYANQKLIFSWFASLSLRNYWM